MKGLSSPASKPMSEIPMVRQALGIVTNRYKVVQNEDAFSFTDSLLGEGVTYEAAGSLQHIGRNAYRFANAVSDFAAHVKPLKECANYKESLFARTMDGSALIDRAYELVAAM